MQCKYLDNHWSLTKFCITQFKGKRVEVTKAESTALRQKIAKAKSYDEVTDIAAPWTGDEEMKAIIKAIEENNPRDRRLLPSQYLVEEAKEVEKTEDKEQAEVEKTGTEEKAKGGEQPKDDGDTLFTFTFSSSGGPLVTPTNTQNPEPPSLNAPFLPNNFERLVPPPTSGSTPTPPSSKVLLPTSS